MRILAEPEASAPPESDWASFSQEPALEEGLQRDAGAARQTQDLLVGAPLQAHVELLAAFPHTRAPVRSIRALPLALALKLLRVAPARASA